MSNVPISDCQAKYCAHDTQKSGANDHVGKLARPPVDAKVEPKPHVGDPAQFALQTPYLPQVILADELGRRRTIETGIVFTQYWKTIKQIDGEDRIYMIRETKSTLDEAKLRPTELAKSKAAKKHIAAIGVEGSETLEGYGRSTPVRWNI